MRHRLAFAVTHREEQTVYPARAILGHVLARSQRDVLLPVALPQPEKPEISSVLTQQPESSPPARSAPAKTWDSGAAET
jgi:hypothetical protein